MVHQNQLLSVGPAQMTYDPNGNTTTDDLGHTLTYDGKRPANPVV